MTAILDDDWFDKKGKQMAKRDRVTLNDLLAAGVTPDRIKVNGKPILDQTNDQTDDQTIALMVDTLSNINETNGDLAELIRLYDQRIKDLEQRVTGANTLTVIAGLIALIGLFV